MELPWVILLASVLFSNVFADDDFSSLDVVIEHSFDEGKTFRPKGIISSWSSEGTTQLLNEPPLTKEEQMMLAKLALSDSLYVIRAYAKPNSFVLMSSCQASHLMASDGKLALILSIDASGSPIAISSVTSNQSFTKDPGSLTSPPQISTTVSFQKPALAIGPDTQEYLARLEKQREEKLRQEQSDNRSFFSKYWMYIVPFVIFVMFLKAGDPNAGGE
ncbi:unnamed protein product [Rodentolepis nana]|uniref:ER membrane protein complex subunit 10 n=1 Tax=Rodentolepis nana TaxID=102285 RepID=A0A0R3TTS5_RODNA|nr:unnamed protein product [Rodentolepis nana]